MLLYFYAKLEALNLTYIEFFETAYQRKFGKLVSLEADYAEYLLLGRLPIYVTDYLKELQQCESSTAPSAAGKSLPEMTNASCALPAS